jgi:hypothetical protein
LGRDYYVAIASSAYSVHPEAIGRMITMTASLDRIRAHCGDRMVADHERLWGANGLASDSAHVSAASVLRQQYLHRRTGPEDRLEVDVEVADLGAYDAVFGTGEVA